MDELVKPLTNLSFNFNNALPNDMYHLDRDPASCSGGSIAIFPWSAALNNPGGLFTVQNGYMYTHNSGINDFFVESEINLAFRDWEDTQNKRFYDKYEYTDVDDLFDAKIINDGNFYKYDKSLSKKYFQLGISASFGEIQPNYYDPATADTCWTTYPKRLIYSLQSSKEAKKDFWRVFLPKNYVDFKSKVNTILPISEVGALILFPYVSPKKFMGVDVLQTQNQTKYTIGDGGLFSKPPMNVVNSDISHEYGSCESARSAISTPAGVFFISQAQGKIFQYTSKGLVNIANQGMKWWFNKYLPSQLLAQFPAIEDCPSAVDNPMSAAGCQTIYDPNNDIVYFSKRDFVLKEQWKANVDYYPCLGFFYRDEQGEDFEVHLHDEAYFEDVSWTVSFDAKANAWISFHDWHPELAMHSINHFMTTKGGTTEIPGCPPQYTWNGTDCCLHIQETNLGFIDISNTLAIVDEQDATVNAFAETVDVAIVIDNSGSTGPGQPMTSQLSFAQTFIAGMSDGMLGGTYPTQCRIGHGLWDGPLLGCTPPEWAVVEPMTNDPVACAASLTAANYNSSCGTDYDNAVALANNLLTGSTATHRIVLFITDATITVPNPANFTNATKCIAVYANNAATQQACNTYSANLDTMITMTGLSAPNNIATCNTGGTPPRNMYHVGSGIASGQPGAFDTVAQEIVDTLIECNCDTAGGWVEDTPQPFPCSPDPLDPPPRCVKCECPATYELIPGQTCSSTNIPLCKKVTCDCINPPNPAAVLTQTGTCPTYPTQAWIDAGTPGWVDPDPVTCEWEYHDCVPANYTVGGIWKHNYRTDLYANYYGIDYPWEIDLLESTGQIVNTVRSVEYYLESYVYKNNGRDRWHDLDFNFDEAIVRNTEQISGLLTLDLSPKNNVPLILTYPIIGINDIRILYSKEEQKYRFNQFWDITDDRGEFTGVEQPIYITRLNGYIRDLNAANLNYNKPALQRKKFRHYYNNVVLRRTVSGDRKMLLRLNNTKINVSQR
jgi:hypothetical protein